jgi:signal transduction histidine kinase
MSLSPTMSAIRRGVRWMAVSWLVWTAIVLLEIGPALVNRSSPGEFVDPVVARRFILVRASLWYGWWLLTPFIFYLARRFPFEAGARRRSFVVHGIAAFAAIQVNNAIVYATLLSLQVPTARRVISFSFAGLLQYSAICGVAVIIRLLQRERDHAIAKAQLETELAHARLNALTAQLRPHFLYNALNGVAMLIRAKDDAAALESVLGYGELLRYVLDAEASDVPLERELAFLDKYLAIERMRFPETFSATITASNSVANALVPNFILQPLVENALHHGLRDLETNARLDVDASRYDGVVRIEVRDNGVGLPPKWRLDDVTGVGLRNTQARLRQRYGDEHHFELHSPPEGGTAVILEIPYQPAPASGGR